MKDITFKGLEQAIDLLDNLMDTKEFKGSIDEKTLNKTRKLLSTLRDDVESDEDFGMSNADDILNDYLE